MASLVLILSFLARTKIGNQASIESASSFDTLEDDSSLLARGTELRKYKKMLEMVGEKMVEEPKVCIYLV
ncbi:hypothetical protein VNO80_13654 [Phaseolus coccineus]|uniref:Uncharacterized protein n=1 Tax=Phaseolus coccineus TaxID=3886 RepID=A0AAN9RFW8_PHACN